jgi:hypothetical protein
MLFAGSNSGLLQKRLQGSAGLLTAGLQQWFPGNQYALITGFNVCDHVLQGCPQQPFCPVSLDRVAY